MMMQPSTTMMKILAIRYPTTFIILGNHEKTLKLSTHQMLLRGKTLGIHSTLTVFLLRQMFEGKTKKSEFTRSNQLCPAVLVFINVKQYPISRKT